MSYSGQTTIGVWRLSWQSAEYKRKLTIGLVIISVSLIALPFFYQATELRNGFLINDYLLREIPAIDVSIYIFIIIWSMALLTFSSFKADPQIFITFLWGYILINLTRSYLSD